MISKTFRTTVLACLFLSQAQLLWLAELHWYEESWPTPACRSLVDNGNRRGLPLREHQGSCVVCQIVRQNAVRPGLVALVSRPVTSEPMRAITVRSFHSTFQPLITYGRAPPAI
jgi:hypothetical protein